MEDSFYATDDTLPGTLRGYSSNPQSGQLEDKTVLNPAVPGGGGDNLDPLRPQALC